jgi:hypothetical protein
MPSPKGTGFEQPLKPHQHWHIDVSYINAYGTFDLAQRSGWVTVVLSCIGICESR